AIALGGVEIGSGIASEQQKAVETNSGACCAAPSPRMRGMSTLAVAVLLISEPTKTASEPKRAIITSRLFPASGSCATIHSASPLREVAALRQRPPPIIISTSQGRLRRSSSLRSLGPKNATIGRRATVPAE